jgi:RNA polymerase-interacting CarD/CdnL/TRCF family regulator
MNQPAPMRLDVGDVVVYGWHGVGRVAADDGRAAGQAILVLEFEGGLRVSLPVARAHELLRPLSNPRELAQVERTLRADATPDQQQWSQRLRATREKLTAGLATGLAEVVRDGIHRERRRGAIASPAEQELYLKARRLLAAEISVSRGIDQVDADDWIAEQIEQSDSPVARAVTATP